MEVIRDCFVVSTVELGQFIERHQIDFSGKRLIAPALSLASEQANRLEGVLKEVADSSVLFLTPFVTEDQHEKHYLRKEGISNQSRKPTPRGTLEDRKVNVYDFSQTFLLLHSRLSHPLQLHFQESLVRGPKENGCLVLIPKKRNAGVHPF